MKHFFVDFMILAAAFLLLLCYHGNSFSHAYVINSGTVDRNHRDTPLLLCMSGDCFSNTPSGPNGHHDRRFFLNTVAVSACALTTPKAAFAGGSSIESLTNDLKLARKKMEPIPDLLKKEEWDAVRTILKTPPVGQLWNLGDSKNYLVNLANLTEELELLEVKDELATTLQMCDQLTYDNAFVYFQPGNGKINIKEPTMLAKKAMKQMDDALALLQ